VHKLEAKPILPSSANLFIFIMAPVITFMLSLIAWVVIRCAVYVQEMYHIDYVVGVLNVVTFSVEAYLGF
jgi:NADH:ubiquinone oxidoreductase subunit H